jgi:hypothetical protein
MKPMGFNSTPFIPYHKIDVSEVDLLEDAWGLNSEFYDVIRILKEIRPDPGKRVTQKLIEKIRKHY